MRLTTYTDYALRTLMYLAVNRERLVTIQDIATLHTISKNHLTKVVHHLGQIGLVTTVKVTDAFCVERYSHVMHIVSNVEGTLLDGMTSMDVLKATFPAGTLTGAPKVHAMELIDQLEPVKRGIYGGACCYLSYAGDMDVEAAAGVVADSVPELEWAETEAKARALLRAAELVEEGLE